MNTTTQSRTSKFHGMTPGFTLVELLIVMLVMSITMGAIYAIYATVVKTYSHQREIANMQQNMRAAMYLIKNDIRNAGRNPLMDGSVGITGVGRWNPDADDPLGYPGIIMTSRFDANFDGDIDTTDPVRTIAYRVFDTDGDGRRELRRWDSQSPNPAWDLVFDGIEDIGFAYAYDTDNDLDLDRSAVAGGGLGPVIWAINTDNLQGLDVNVDNVPDGDVNVLDDGDNDGDIDTVDGGLGTQIDLNDIRAVRIWILARSRQIFPDYTDSGIYTLGHKVIDMSDPVNANRNNFRHRLLVGAVAMNNHQRKP